MPIRKLKESAWPAVYERVRRTLDVVNGGFAGETNLGDPDVSWLTDDDLIDSVTDPAVEYIVWSYDIPIGWWAPESGWRINYTRASKTTKGHVNHLRRALTEWQGPTTFLIPGRFAAPSTDDMARRIMLSRLTDEPGEKPWTANFIAEVGSGEDVWTWWEATQGQKDSGRARPNRLLE